MARVSKYDQPASVPTLVETAATRLASEGRAEEAAEAAAEDRAEDKAEAETLAAKIAEERAVATEANVLAANAPKSEKGTRYVLKPGAGKHHIRDASGAYRCVLPGEPVPEKAVAGARDKFVQV